MLQRVRPQWTRSADRVIRAPRGTTLSAKSWLTEAPLRMLMNNLDPEVAENPRELVVYGGIGGRGRRATARRNDGGCFDAVNRVPAIADRDAPADALSRSPGTRSR